MNNESLPITEYVLSQYEFDAPALQREYGLTYPETMRVINGMLKRGEITFKSGVTYSVAPNEKQEAKREGSEDISELLRALWTCIVLKDVTARVIGHNLKIGFAEAMQLIERLEKHGYITRYPERRVLMTADEFIYKFGRRDFISEPVAGDMWVDDDGILNINDGPDPKEKLFHAVCSHIGDSDRNAYEKYIYDNAGNVMFAVEEKPECIRITDRGAVLTVMPLSKTKIDNVLKRHKNVALDGDELTLTVKNYDDVFYGLLDLYSAISDVFKSVDNNQ